MAPEYKIYQGFHSQELYTLLQKAWHNETPLIIAPPHLKNLNLDDGIKLPSETILGLYTSGTLTGKPRLILYSKKNIESSLKAIRSLYAVEKIDQIFCYPQPTHTFGLTLGYLHSILHDIPLQFLTGPYSTKSHELWLENLTPGQLTLGTPTHFIDLIQFVKKNALEVKESYSAIIGGAPVTQKLWHDLRNDLKIAAPSIGYGATEASPGIMHLAPGVEPIGDGDIGAVLPNVKISKLDENGFYFSGENLCLGAVDQLGLHLMNEVQIRDYLTERKTGRFIFNGRSDLIVNRGGLKLSPEMIEGRLSSELNLTAVCLSIYSERLGEDIALVIQPNESDQKTLAEVTSQVNDLLKREFSVVVSPENILRQTIPLNANLKFDRIECAKMILNKNKMQCPLSVEHLKPFLPHRSSAIWIQRLTQFAYRKGKAEVDLDLQSSLFSNAQLRESTCIELVAQTYGYAKAAYEISILDVNNPTEKANKTLIAEIRNADFYFNRENDQLIANARSEGIPLLIEAQCTHEFGPIKVVRGTVQLKDTVLAELSLKAFVSPDVF